MWCGALAGDRNYPWKTRRHNTYDIALPDATDDAKYLSILSDWLPTLMERHRPQLVFYQAGVDAMQGDAFGRSDCCHLMSCIVQVT